MSTTEAEVTTSSGAYNALTINGVQVAAVDPDDFLASNKRTTEDYRAALAQAIGTTGKIAKVVKMAFGVGGEADLQGNPMPPTGNGPLNDVVLTKAIAEVTYPVATTVCFMAEIAMGEVTAAINEVALVDEDDNTVAKMRLLTSKGTDAESGLIFRWYVEF